MNWKNFKFYAGHNSILRGKTWFGGSHERYKIAVDWINKESYILHENGEYKKFSFEISFDMIKKLIWMEVLPWKIRKKKIG